VALTGGIATGKSVVARILAERGCFVQSADHIAHDLIRPGRPAWKRIVSHFGTQILNPDQTINRSLLGKIIFSSDAERLFLNQVLHPLVQRQRSRVVRRLEREKTPRIFVSEAALTIESGFTRFFDRIVVVYCPQKIQVERLMKRDAMPAREARERIRSQMPGEKKIPFADYLIDTSGSLADTLDQARRLYRSLAADFRKKQLRKKSPRAGIKL